MSKRECHVGDRLTPQESASIPVRVRLEPDHRGHRLNSIRHDLRLMRRPISSLAAQIRLSSHSTRFQLGVHCAKWYTVTGGSGPSTRRRNSCFQTQLRTMFDPRPTAVAGTVAPAPQTPPSRDPRPHSTRAKDL